MTTLTLSRPETDSKPATSIDLPLNVEAAGLAYALDVGKPHQRIKETGTLYPKPFDNWGPVVTITLNATLTGTNAYRDAKQLAEDLIRPHSHGETLTLDVSTLPEFTSPEPVAPIGKSALQVAYEPGQTDWVDVQLTVPFVGDTVG